MVKIYTRKGDDGTTGLLFGGRIGKGAPIPTAYGTVDEAQAFIGLARAHAETSSEAGVELDAILVGLERDLWVLMADLATDRTNRGKLVAGQTLVTDDMVTALESLIDDLGTRFELPQEFVVPGETIVAAHLDVARTVVRRAEREAVHISLADSRAVAYLNRLSDLLWALARWQESLAGSSRTSRSV